MELSPLDVRQADPYVLFFFLLIGHFLVLFVDFWGDAILFEGVDVFSDAKYVSRAPVDIVQVRR